MASAAANNIFRDTAPGIGVTNMVCMMGKSERRKLKLELRTHTNTHAHTHTVTYNIHKLKSVHFAKAFHIYRICSRSVNVES